MMRLWNKLALKCLSIKMIWMGSLFFISNTNYTEQSVTYLLYKAVK